MLHTLFQKKSYFEHKLQHDESKRITYSPFQLMECHQNSYTVKDKRKGLLRRGIVIIEVMQYYHGDDSKAPDIQVTMRRQETTPYY
uniref:Uncharacterized protein n=1 Tax=Strigamia maritima TaxID=126957 RepID=T1IJX1_STRMM